MKGFVMKKSNMSMNACQFLELIKSGRLPKEILPNSSPNYTLYQERFDTDFYNNVFLQSSAYDFVRKCEDVTYDGE